MISFSVIPVRKTIESKANYDKKDDNTSLPTAARKNIFCKVNGREKIYFEKPFGKVWKINDQSKTKTLISVDSAAVHLFVTHGSLLAMAKQKGGIQKLIMRAHVISYVFKIASNNSDEIERDELDQWLSDFKIKQTKANALTNAVQKALKNKTSNYILPFAVNDYLITDNEQELFLIGKRLCDGRCGLIYPVLNLERSESRTELVLKLSKNETGSLKDLANECRILKKIHANGQIIGIQFAPYKVLDIPTTKVLDIQTTYKGYLTKKYDCDYYSYPYEDLSIENKLLEIFQLFEGLEYLHSINIIHSDIKDENILIKFNANGTNQVVLADFGGAIDASTDDSSLELITFTPQFTPLPDIEKYMQLWGKPNNRKLIIDLHKKRDVFAFGSFLYFVFSNGDYPYVFQKQLNPLYIRFSEYPNFYEYFEMENNIPSYIQTTIKQMLHPDYTKRPTVSEALHALKNGHAASLKS